MEEKIIVALQNNFHALLGFEEDYEFQEDYGRYELIEMAGNLAKVFENKDKFNKEQLIGIIKYENFSCWHEIVEDSICEKVVNEILA